MGILKFGVSAIGKLAAVALLVAAFFFGLVAVVYMSLQGSEVRVPEITGKNFTDSEKELALLGLKIKRRAERPSGDAPNTVLEQLPKPGETVKTGQLILVVTSKLTAEGDETPSTLKKSINEDDTEKIEEMISDKPKKSRSNSNSNTTRKKADTTRDLLGNTATSTTNSDTADGNPNKKESGTNDNPPDKGNKNTMTGPSTKQSTPPAGKPAPKPADRPRMINRP